MSIRDFPKRDPNSELASKAEAEFERAVVQAGLFVVQQRDRSDYGTDVQIEAKLRDEMSNIRVHVQLKGTDKLSNADGSVSISVSRTNFNYLLSQPGSVYVCYHNPTDTLLIRSAEDVFREAEHEGGKWRSSRTVTIRFHAKLDSDFQTRLHARVVSRSHTESSERLVWVAARPEMYPETATTAVPPIVVPESPEDAAQALEALYEKELDEVISKAFDQFIASLDPNEPRFFLCHLAEINLAMRQRSFDPARIRSAIELIEQSRPGNDAGMLYNLANAHAALGESMKAKACYKRAIALTGDDERLIAAQCWKNLGSEHAKDGDDGEAKRCYEKSISIAPDLMEAHMALGVCAWESAEYEAALRHFDIVVWSFGETACSLTARGYRVDAYFQLGAADSAFGDVTALLGERERFPWVVDWCAMQVFNHARSVDGSVIHAIRFWRSYLKFRADDRRAQRELLVCLAFAKMSGFSVDVDFESYSAEVSQYVAQDDQDAAFLWDRVGHWAQVDGDWDQAETQYRKAYNLEPERYGYCLGVSLNFLRRFEEALPILLEQASEHLPDAKSWFQVAVAQEGVGDIDGAKKSYRKSLSLDKEYDLAMFNLGGLYWNNGPKEEAIRIWGEAIERFPEHALAAKIRVDFPQHFGHDN